MVRADQPSGHSGTSLFDKLFINADDPDQSHEIPYPFSLLIERLESQLGVSVNNDANRVKLTLIPFGRCVYRYAAAPDFFRYPRVVLAIDSEHVGHEAEDYLSLKDKFFLGYREHPGILEVISYSTEAGRFEFQTVSNYRYNSVPVVEDAPRSDCTSCHQNEGPIFPGPPYLETDSSPKLYRRILAAQGVPLEQITTRSRNEAGAVDGSANRANMFGLYQLFWMAGCRSSSEFEESRCRAGLLDTVLRARLADVYRIQTPTRLAANFMIPVAGKNVRQRWPTGIKLHSSDIPTQSPLLVGEEAHLASAELLKIPRNKSISWQSDDLYRIVQGLGQLIPRQSIRRLDQALLSAAVSNRSAAEHIEHECQLRMINRVNRFGINDDQSKDLSVACVWPKSDLSPGINLHADIGISNGFVKGYPYSGMAIGGESFILSLTHSGGQVVEEEDGKLSITFSLLDTDNYLHARLPNGRIIKRIMLQWDRSALASAYKKNDPTLTGRGTITLLKNLGALDNAIATLMQLQDDGHIDVFSDKPFDAGKMMLALFSVL